MNGYRNQTQNQNRNRGYLRDKHEINRVDDSEESSFDDPFDFPSEQQAAQRDRASFYQGQDRQDRQDSRNRQGSSGNGNGQRKPASSRQRGQTPQVSQSPEEGASLVSPEFEILNFRRHEGNGPTRAFFSLAVHFGRRNSKGTGGDPLVLNDCRLVMNRDGEPFVATAQREWIDNQGQRKYSPIFELPKSWRRVVLDTVLDTVVEAAGGWPI